jgi:hypothetical protein
MIQICTFKEKGKEGGEGRPQLGGQWKVLSLVALEMNPMPGGQCGSILFDGQWKVLSLVALGKIKKHIIFTSFHFSPHKILFFLKIH